MKILTFVVVLAMFASSGCFDMNSSCFKGDNNVLRSLNEKIRSVLRRNYELSNDFTSNEASQAINDVICQWDVDNNSVLSTIIDNDDLDSEINKRLDITCKTGLMKLVVDKLAGNYDIMGGFLEHRKRGDAYYDPFK